MAGLRKRGKWYYVRFTRQVKGRRYEKMYALGTQWKGVARNMVLELEKLHQSRLINPFRDGFSVEGALNDQDEDTPDTLRYGFNRFIAASSYKAARTIQAYEDVWNHFFDFTNSERIPLYRLSLSTFEPFLLRPGIKRSTMAFNYRHLKAAINYMKDQGWIDHNPLDKFKLPAFSPNHHEKMLTLDELHRIFKAFDKYHTECAKNGAHFEYQRQTWFKPMIATYFYTGLRLHEVAHNRDLPYSGLKGVNLKSNGTIIYLGQTKGHKERLVPIPEVLQKLYSDYFQKRGVPGEDEYLFITYTGGHKGQPITGVTVRKAFNKFCKLAKVPKSRTIHGMRHSRVTEWLKAGLSLKEAAMLAGHSSASVTEHTYSHLVFEDILRKLNG